MLTSAPEAIIFDSDGTLLDSFSLIVGAYGHLATEFGYPAPSEGEVKAQLAQSYPLYQIIATFFPGIDVEKAMQVNGTYIANQAADVATVAGLDDMLGWLHGEGVRLGVVTGGNHKVVDLYEHHGIAHYFDSFVHCDRVERSKPDPEGFLLAVKECAATPGKSIMIGDSPTDIFTGKNGGAGLTIGITHGFADHSDLAAADPDHIVDSIPHLRKILATLIS